MDLLIVVPARGGSKRLPGKNLRPLGGRSLLAHTAEAVAASGLGATVLLSTDDEAIAREGESLGWSVPFRRPAALATDDATTVDVTLHALDWYRRTQRRDPGATMVLQPTSPFRGTNCLLEAVRLLAEHPTIDSVVAMSTSAIPPARLYFMGQADRAESVTLDPRAPVYRPNGAVYLTRTRALRRHRTLFAGEILPLVLDGPRSIDIDTPADWELAEALLANGLPPDLPQPKAVPPVEVRLS